MQDDTNPRAKAMGALAELSLPIVSDAADFAAFECAAIDAGHACVAEAMALALEALDARPMEKRPRSLKCHDVRRRVLATEFGRLPFLPLTICALPVSKAGRIAVNTASAAPLTLGSMPYARYSISAV